MALKKKKITFEQFGSLRRFQQEFRGRQKDQ